MLLFLVYCQTEPCCTQQRSLLLLVMSARSSLSSSAFAATRYNVGPSKLPAVLLNLPVPDSLAHRDWCRSLALPRV
jgi:hypothetical protein